MRRAIFISILLTICTIGAAQETTLAEPVRLVFTSNLQQHPFGQDPVWGGWPEGSMARAMSYIRSHRRARGEDRFAHISCGLALRPPYTLYPDDFAGQILNFVREDCDSEFERGGIGFQIKRGDDDPHSPSCVPTGSRAGILLLPQSGMTLEKIALYTGYPLVVTAFGREPEVCRVIDLQGDTLTVLNLGTTGKYIGVADFTTSSDFTARTVDISGFPADAEYLEHFQPLYDSIRTFFTTPLTHLTDTIRQSDALYGSSAYTGLFHRFQLAVSRARVSLFACPVWDDMIPAGEITPADLLRRFRYENQLCVLELTGKEIQDYLEYSYGLRYNTMRRSTDNLLRMSRDRDGVLGMRTAVYNLDEAAGMNYVVDVSRPQGRRVRINGMSDGSPFRPEQSYRVVVNYHRFSGDPGYLSRATGLSAETIERRVIRRTEVDYRRLLWEWLSGHNSVTPEDLGNWQVIPDSFVGSAKERIYE